MTQKVNLGAEDFILTRIANLKVERKLQGSQSEVDKSLKKERNINIIPIVYKRSDHKLWSDWSTKSSVILNKNCLPTLKRFGENVGRDLCDKSPRKLRLPTPKNPKHMIVIAQSIIFSAYLNWYFASYYTHCFKSHLQRGPVKLSLREPSANPSAANVLIYSMHCFVQCHFVSSRSLTNYGYILEQGSFAKLARLQQLKLWSSMCFSSQISSTSRLMPFF